MSALQELEPFRVLKALHFGVFDIHVWWKNPSKQQKGGEMEVIKHMSDFLVWASTHSEAM